MPLPVPTVICLCEAVEIITSNEHIEKVLESDCYEVYEDRNIRLVLYAGASKALVFAA